MERRDTFLWLDTGEGENGEMELRVKCKSPAEGQVHFRITGPGNLLREESRAISGTEIAFPCPGVELWDPEHPWLYEVSVSLEQDGVCTSRAQQRIGFRSLERKGQVLLWNHRPLKLKGICYRERKGDSEGTRRDLELFAAANVNFLRGIYGPFSEELLRVCDEMGFLVEDTAAFYDVGDTAPATQDLPHLREEYLGAVEEMLSVGSHTSILIWSLGHDCVWGANFRHAAEALRSVDPVRPLTFHLPMSVPQEDTVLDIWPVHYIDWKQPFDRCYDQMVIFHTPGAENEIGYMTAQADCRMPVLHEVWSPVACHNRDEIEKDPYIRKFWGESIRRFAEKSRSTEGCLGGAVLAGVDEDGSFEGMGRYEWGILDRNHIPKPEYEELRAAYAPVAVKSLCRENGRLILELENRFLFSDLSECRMIINGKEILDCGLQGAPGTVVRCCVDTENTQDIIIWIVSKDGRMEYASCRSRGQKRVCFLQQGEERESTGQENPGRKGGAEGGELTISREKEALIVSNAFYSYRFDRKTCLLTSAYAGSRQLLAGGPYLNCTGLLLGEWEGTGLDAGYADGRVQVTIEGSYRGVLSIRFILLLAGDGTLDTFNEVKELFRHLPHNVKAQIGMAPGGLNEKGAAYLLPENVAVTREDAGTYADENENRGAENTAESNMESVAEGNAGSATERSTESAAEGNMENAAKGSTESAVERNTESAAERNTAGCKDEYVRGDHVRICTPQARVRIEPAPWYTPEAMVDDRDPRMEFHGTWLLMDDYCGDYQGTETMSRTAGDSMSLRFRGTGVRLYGPLDINCGMCDVYLDGELIAENVDQYPDKVDLLGASRGYEKRYGLLLAQAHDLPEGEHELVVKVNGRKAPGAQNTYTSIDYAVLEGSAYRVGKRLNVDLDYNFVRLVRGCYKRPRVELVPGLREGFRMKLAAGCDGEV